MEELYKCNNWWSRIREELGVTVPRHHYSWNSCTAVFTDELLQQRNGSQTCTKCYRMLLMRFIS